MGWVAYHREKGETDRAHFGRKLLSGPDHEIVQRATKDRALYAAVSTGEVWALVVLTPTDNHYALQWRERCRANLARRDVVRQRLRCVTGGVVIQMLLPSSFQNGLQACLFRCVHRSGRTLRWQRCSEDAARASGQKCGGGV